MILLDGKQTAEGIKGRIKAELDEYLQKGYRKPCLAAVLVGDDGASRTYIDSKERNSLALGFDSRITRLPAETTQEELLKLIAGINADKDVDGLLVQSPLPPHIDEDLITQSIEPSKDVDGFHDINMGKLAKGLDGFVSATPLGVQMMLEAYGIETSGKHCVIIGRSNIVGRPMSLLMSANTRYGNSTVTLCHSRTRDIAHFTKEADIVIVALGKPGFLKADMVKPGAAVIDVGITRIEDSSRKNGFYLKGDVDFDAVSKVAGHITPVPGGVGLMTIAALLHNTFKAYKQHLGI